VFNFVMKYERLEFPEAVRALAQKAGVIIPETDGRSVEELSRQNALYTAIELATAFFQKNLAEERNGRQAREYLLKRGLSDAMISTLRIGFGPAGWDTLIKTAAQKGIQAETLEKAGLAIARESGGHFDRFRNRIMFPIFDIKSRIIGFGGRVFLPEDTGPKYMNSPETVIYNKSRNLYGLNLTWKDIRDQDQVVIVEGYLDFIVPLQYGIRNIVATLGTSLTQDHIRFLKRYTKNAVVIFDPDKAGELATLRSMDLLLEEDLSVSVVRLSDGFDPDSYVRTHGAEHFTKDIAAARNLFDYKISLLLTKYRKEVIEDKAKIVGEMLPTIARVANAVLRSGYIRSLSQIISIDEEAIWQELKKVRLPGSGGRSAEFGSDAPSARRVTKACVTTEPSKEPAAAALRQAEKVLIGILLDDNSYIAAVRSRLCLDEFRSPALKKIAAFLFTYAEGDGEITLGKLIDRIGDDDVSRMIPELVDATEAVVERSKTLDDCILKIKKENLQEKRTRIQVKIALAQNKEDDEHISLLIAEYQALTNSLRDVEGKASEILQ
ncbi:MAG: DNA primase, partial [Candidatus Omnitrophota bacterium]